MNHSYNKVKQSSYCYNKHKESTGITHLTKALLYLNKYKRNRWCFHFERRMVAANSTETFILSVLGNSGYMKVQCQYYFSMITFSRIVLTNKYTLNIHLLLI